MHGFHSMLINRAAILNHQLRIVDEVPLILYLPEIPRSVSFLRMWSAVNLKNLFFPFRDFDELKRVKPEYFKNN